MNKTSFSKYFFIETGFHMLWFYVNKLYVIQYAYMGRVKRKGVFERAQNAQIQIHPAHAQNLIRGSD